MANFLLKFRNFVTMATGVGVIQIWFAQNWGHILFTRKVIANFLLKFGKFSLPWQQGSSEQSLTNTI